MNKILQAKINRLKWKIARREETCKLLEEDCNKLSEELTYKSNSIDRNNIWRQLETTEQEIERISIEKIAPLYENIKEICVEHSLPYLEVISTSNTSVLDLLLPYQNRITLETINQAFQFCQPVQGWDRPQPNSLHNLVWEVQEMPLDEDERAPILKLVAFLIVQLRISELADENLFRWLKDRNKDFISFLSQVRKQIKISYQHDLDVEAYLLVLVQPSKIDQAKMSISGYEIPDFGIYNPLQGKGFQVLDSVIKDSKTFTFQELSTALPVLMQGYLDQCTTEPTIELFLPLSLLNSPINTWFYKEYNCEIPIHCEQKIIIRSSERLRRYRHNRTWKKKWRYIQENIKITYPASGIFEDGDCDIDKLLYRLGEPKTVALKSVKAPKQNCKNDFFRAVLRTGTPVALWMRSNLGDHNTILKYQETQINYLLNNCDCISKVPDAVYENRRETLLPDNQGEDTHIGHHLALLWENPYRLPPDIETII